VFIVSKAGPVLPFSLEDAARSETLIAEREEEIEKAVRAALQYLRPHNR
jgi:hypothetical protein